MVFFLLTIIYAHAILSITKGVKVIFQSIETKLKKSSAAAVERLPALHYSVDFIFLSFGIMGFIWEL